MKNLKRVLCLVLMFAMVMSLGFSAMAADFSDWDNVENKEAVELITALGIVDGKPDGEGGLKFDPTAELKRVEGIKMIAVALWTGDDRSELFAGTGSQFSDVPAAHWGLGYINFGVVQGVLSGTSPTTFAPEAPLTGTAFLKMVLTALGIDKTRYEGAGWDTRVLADATRKGLVDDMIFNPSANLNRDNAAMIIYNMMNANVANADGTDEMTVKEDPFSLTLDGDGKVTGITGGKMTATPTTFGEKNFDFHTETVIVIENKWGAVDNNTNVDAVLADSDNPANGTRFYPTIVRKDVKDSVTYKTTQSFRGLMQETDAEDLGKSFNVIRIGSEVLSWNEATNTVIAKNDDNNNKTIDPTAGKVYVNYARPVATVDLNLANVVDNGTASAKIAAKANMANTLAVILAYAKANVASGKDYATVQAILDDAAGSKTAANLAEEIEKVLGLTSNTDAVIDLVGNGDTAAAVATSLANIKAKLNSNLVDMNLRDTGGLKGNVVVFLDNNGDGTADFQFITAYAYDVVDSVEGKIDDAKDAYELSTSADIKKSKVTEELAKGDRIVSHTIAGTMIVDEILKGVDGQVARRNGAQTNVTIGGKSYDVANFAGASGKYDQGLNTDQTFFFFNGLLVTFEGEVADKAYSKYAVITGVLINYDSTADFSATSQTIDVKVQATLDTGVSGVYDLAKLYVPTGLTNINDSAIVDKSVTPKAIVEKEGFGTAVVTEFIKLVTGVTSGSLTGGSYLYKMDNDEGNFNYNIVEYVLTADGKGIEITNIDSDATYVKDDVYEGLDSLSTAATYDKGGNRIGGMVVDGSTIFFVQNSATGFAVYKGIGNIPDLENLAVSGVRKQFFAYGKFGDKLTVDTIAYGIIGRASGATDIVKPADPVTGVYAIVSDFEEIETGVFEFSMFNGEKVETYTSVMYDNVADFVSSGIKKGAIFGGVTINNDGHAEFNVDVYSNTDADGLFTHADLNADYAALGYLTFFGDGTARLVDAAGANPELYTYDADTKYFLIDGNDSGVLKIADVKEQTVDSSNSKYQAIFIGGVSDLNTLILLAGAVDMP